MTYADALNVAQVSGLGVEIIDENVGTGDASEVDFDLDNDNIVAGSYSLYHAASGSNTMTALIETTHYSLDKSSGRIVLEAAGVTALGTDILYATYQYIDGGISDTLLTQWLTWADSEVDKSTGQYWGTPISVTEYFSSEKTNTYPHTDRPFADDWDSADYLVMKKVPITGVNYVWILTENLLAGQVWSYDDNLATYTDNTDEANSVEGTAFDAFADTPAANDILYVGASQKFHKLLFLFATLGS